MIELRVWHRDKMYIAYGTVPEVLWVSEGLLATASAIRPVVAKLILEVAKEIEDGRVEKPKA